MPCKHKHQQLQQPYAHDQQLHLSPTVEAYESLHVEALQLAHRCLTLKLNLRSDKHKHVNCTLQSPTLGGHLQHTDWPATVLKQELDMLDLLIERSWGDGLDERCLPHRTLCWWLRSWHRLSLGNGTRST